MSGGLYASQELESYGDSNGTGIGPGVGVTLTSAQRDAYWEDGYLYPVRVMDSTEARSTRAEFEAFEQRWRDDPSLPEPFENYLRANLHVVCRVAARTAAHPVITDAVGSLLGENLLCWMVELIAKEPRSDRILTMHQDLTYWGLRGTDRVVTAWLALSEVRLDNGAMRFVTGSHRNGQVTHNDTYGLDNLLSRGQEIAVDYDPADEVAVELDPGEMSLHHGHMFHGSGPNRTDTRRLGLVIRYVTPAVEQAVATRDYGLLVRGANRTSSLITVAPPTRDFSWSSTQLHREISSAQQAALADQATQRFGYIPERRIRAEA